MPATSDESKSTERPSEPESFELLKLGRARKGPKEVVRVRESGSMENTISGGVCRTCLMTLHEYKTLQAWKREIN